jgi:hypothetical protein
MPCSILDFTYLIEIFYGYRLVSKLEFFAVIIHIFQLNQASRQNYCYDHKVILQKFKVQVSFYFKKHNHPQLHTNNEQPKIRSHSSRVLRRFNRRIFCHHCLLNCTLIFILSISMMMLMFFRSML